jgi:SAM-dependent methyltransferase
MDERCCGASEPPVASLQREDLLAFERGEKENRKFWSRFGGIPNLSGQTVLDVGSGWGKLCIELGLSGLRRVIGLEIKQRLVAFSNAILRRSYSRLVNRVAFERCDLRQYDEEEIFDTIVSKDSFEHILDLDTMLQAMRRRLKPGGRIYAGFGPLYTSPFGDHDRREVAFKPLGPLGKAVAKVPWLHLPLEQVVVKLHRRQTGADIRTIQDLGLNGLSISDYRRAFRDSGLTVVDLRINQGSTVASTVLSKLAQVPVLEDYCVHNMYCVLEKRG